MIQPSSIGKEGSEFQFFGGLFVCFKIMTIVSLFHLCQCVCVLLKGEGIMGSGFCVAQEEVKSSCHLSVMIPLSTFIMSWRPMLVEGVCKQHQKAQTSRA